MGTLSRRFARPSKEEEEEITAIRNAITSDGCSQLDYYSVRVALSALDLNYEKNVLNKARNLYLFISESTGDTC
jgi:hypothetical protein